MDRRKIALILPWYGLETAGGAEIHARRLAESLHEAGVAIEVLTTCGKDYFTPQAVDYYPAGLGEVNGVPVRRFRRRQDSGESFFAAHPEVLAGVERPSSDHYHPVNELHAEDALFDFILAHRDEYYYVFMPYVWGLTVFGARLCPEHSFLIPCLHDEPWAYAQPYRAAFIAVRGLLFNAGPEMEFAHERYGFDRQRAAVIGEGIDMDWPADARRFRVKYGLYDPFLLFVGRRDEGKRALMLISYFAEFKARHPSNLRLALAGKNPLHIPPALAQDVIDLGFLEDQDKHDAYAAAAVFCLPSVIESFSIVLMEAWLQGTPALVNAACAVTTDHCQKSRGGLYFRDYFEFEGCLEYLLGRPDVRARMGASGGAYVRQNYHWRDVVRRFVAQVYGE